MALKWPIMCWCAVKKLLTHTSYERRERAGSAAWRSGIRLSQWVFTDCTSQEYTPMGMWKWVWKDSSVFCGRTQQMPKKWRGQSVLTQVDNVVDSDPHYSGACVCCAWVCIALQFVFVRQLPPVSLYLYCLGCCCCCAGCTAAWWQWSVSGSESWGGRGGATFPSSVGSVTDRGLLLIRPACVAVGRSSVCNWLRTSPLIAYTWSIRSAPDLDSVLSSYPQPTRHPDQKFYLNYSEYIGLFLCTVKLCFLCFLFTGC